jgi:sigma-B regulation protein RsbU (phosphoserine phosphatase)
VTEAENVEKILYSEDRLLAKLSGRNGESSEQIIREVIGDVELHSAGAEQSDDITVLCIKYL